MFKDSSVFISGITGSWASELVKQLQRQGVEKIIGVSRNEAKQVEFRRNHREYDNIELHVGDVRNKELMMELTHEVDYVFHLAAIKHIDIAENNPKESISVNVNGTQTLIDCAIHNDVDKFIFVSTDKACEPNNLYGMTKAVAERLTIQANNSKTNFATDFIVIRAGNVLNSNGSIIPLFKKQILEDKRVTITHPEMTRFLMTLPEAVGLVLNATNHGIGGETFVTPMDSCKIETLIDVLIAKYSPDEYIPVDTIGMREGEKLYESLISRHDLELLYDKKTKMFIILPSLKMDDNFNKNYDIDLNPNIEKCVRFKESYNSATECLSKADLRNYLEENNII